MVKGRGRPNKKHGSSKYKPRDNPDASKTNTHPVGEKDRRAKVEHIPRIETDSDPPVENTENSETTVESKKYAKRKIESNWDRYEEPVVVDEHLIVEEEYDETKDFDYIRQNSASALSHFKFKEEEEWDKDITKDGENVLGLNLGQLAGNLASYGVEEKLSLGAMIPEECKYCVRNVMLSVPQPPKSVPGPKIMKESVRWSFQGVERYMHSLGIDVNQGSVGETGSCTSVDLSRSYDDDEALDELLMNSMTINDSTYSRHKQDPVKEVQAAVLDAASTTEKTSMGGNKVSDGPVDGELDLDALLDLDSLDNSGDNQDLHIEGHTDSDLDQWLDEMLT